MMGCERVDEKRDRQLTRKKKRKKERKRCEREEPRFVYRVQANYTETEREKFIQSLLCYFGSKVFLIIIF